jgi:hypothetical protein
LFILIQSKELSRNRHFELHCDRNLYLVASVRTVTLCYLLIVKAVAKESYETHNLELLVIVETFKQWWHYFESSTHSMKVLTDHNNLCEFMNVKILNKRQAQWAVRLTVFDFVILHRSSKTNLVDVSLRHSDYIKVISESIDKLLSTLQKSWWLCLQLYFSFDDY